MVGQEFMDIAFSLRQGDVSRLIETPRGFQIIKVTETHGQRNLDLDDIFQLGTVITVRDYIGNVLLQQTQQEVLARVTQELIIELRTGNPFRIYENNLNF
jgi:parvulin-like peptidyl-prolyl isomerase